MDAEHEGVLIERVARRVAGPDAPRDLHRFLTWMATVPREGGFEDVLLDRAREHCDVSQARMVAVFREFETLGAGVFVVGRRGHPSRFRPGRHNLAIVARGVLAPSEARPAPLPAVPAAMRHSFRLRPDLGVEFDLPADLTGTEAERLAAFVLTLPFAAPRRRAAAYERVTIGMSRLRISIPVMVAVREGMFAREGMEVALETFETAQPLMDAIVSGELPAGGFVAFPISMAAELASGVRVRHGAVMIEDDDHPVSRFLARRGAGVTRLGDVRGRRVGILPTFAYRTWLELLLGSEGVDPASVEIIEVRSQDAVGVIGSGAVDALFTNDPAATAVLASGKAVPLDPEPRIPRAVQDPLPFGSFVIAETFARERPHIARALVRVLDAAIDVVTRDPRRASAALMHCLPRAERSLVKLYPPALYGKAASVRPETLARLSRRYSELKILDGPVAAATFGAPSQWPTGVSAPGATATGRSCASPAADR